VRARRQGYLYRGRGAGSKDVNRSGVCESFVGFAVSASVAILISGILFLCGPLLVSLYPEYDAELVKSAYEHQTILSGKILIFAMAVYWLVCAANSRSNILEKILANWIIAVAILLYFLAFLQILPIFRGLINTYAMYDCTVPCPAGIDEKPTFCLRTAMICPNWLGWVIDFLFYGIPVLMLFASLYIRLWKPEKQ
jgi:hypothetical protein